MAQAAPAEDRLTALHDAMTRMCDRMDAFMERFASKRDDDDDGRRRSKRRDDEDGEPEAMASDDDRERDDAAEPSDKPGVAVTPAWEGSEQAKYAGLDSRKDALAAREHDLLERQHRSDAVCHMWGRERILPRVLETPRGFMTRVGTVFQKHSPPYKHADLRLIRDNAALRAAYETILDDASKAATSNESPTGLQRMITREDPSGRRYYEFFGPIDAWNGTLQPFKSPAYRVKRFNNTPSAYY
jgi:hypothetical protein